MRPHAPGIRIIEHSIDLAVNDRGHAVDRRRPRYVCGIDLMGTNPERFELEIFEQIPESLGGKGPFRHKSDNVFPAEVSEVLQCLDQ